ncbi:hypothetical protein L210DRAFT_2661229 [Boletus edulis BED1]|uniref:Uncharacterized protein n=1 Tax=Boletus edulis BED1 TaxID=1328754 RepID=A0AAD4C6Y8_BOLED|nr:hypothetical protein L210DRAFT_2661229 [Boletus edulis BED1]
MWIRVSNKHYISGGLLYVVLCIGNGHPTDGMKLLEFRVDDDSRNLSGPISSDVPISFPVGDLSLRVESGDAPFLFISADPSLRHVEHALIFDIRTRIFYEFPQSGLDPGPYPSFKVVLTMTHIILCHSHTHRVIEAYVIPDDKETNELRLTHETMTDMPSPVWWFLLRNPVVDPITGSTHLRFLLLSPYNFDQFRFVCADMTLPANSTENVLPLLLDADATTMGPMPYSYIVRPELIQSSADGFARGLGLQPGIPGKLYIGRFGIDATGEQCMVDVGRMSSIPVAADMSCWERASFDGTSGRLCGVTVPTADSPGNYTAMVLDVE